MKEYRIKAIIFGIWNIVSRSALYVNKNSISIYVAVYYKLQYFMDYFIISYCSYSIKIFFYVNLFFLSDAEFY
jgi:hypothetical protein